MKIESIKDITNDSLKELSASAVSDFIESELKEASERFSAEKAQVESNLKEAQEKIEAVTTDYDKIKAELDSVTEKLGALETEKAEKEAEEAQQRREYGYVHPTVDDYDESLDDPNYEEPEEPGDEEE